MGPPLANLVVNMEVEMKRQVPLVGEAEDQYFVVEKSQVALAKGDNCLRLAV